MPRLILILIVCVIIWQWYQSPGSVILGPGVMAGAVPEQVSIDDADNFMHQGYTIQPLAEFAIQAKVLSRKDYHFGRGADIGPVDLALGWGRMSDEMVLQKIDIRQSNRWYRWSTNDFPIPRREIETSSANMHMLPANGYIKKRLKSVRKGDVIKLTGKLVYVTNDDGFQWRSSLTRNDTGDGACELIWVETLTILSEDK